MHVPAPKMKLPGHEESYNPPPEYLLSEEEVRGRPWVAGTVGEGTRRGSVGAGSWGRAAGEAPRLGGTPWSPRRVETRRDLARETKAKVPQPPLNRNRRSGATSQGRSSERSWGAKPGRARLEAGGERWGRGAQRGVSDDLRGTSSGMALAGPGAGSGGMSRGRSGVLPSPADPGSPPPRRSWPGSSRNRPSGS